MSFIKTSTFVAALALATALPLAAQASGYERLTEEQRANITAAMTEQGYETRKIEMEDGMIEVYAVKDGERFELYLDNNFEIIRISRDD
ncbi:PepSY domain-containing protein [Rhodobacteraceae bacterium XHP0102]|nr:PepSY domain-containing protein [Rhodobacteraceae bacterium XHP0102]